MNKRAQEYSRYCESVARNIGDSIFSQASSSLDWISVFRNPYSLLNCRRQCVQRWTISKLMSMWLLKSVFVADCPYPMSCLLLIFLSPVMCLWEYFFIEMIPQRFIVKHETKIHSVSILSQLYSRVNKNVLATWVNSLSQIWAPLKCDNNIIILLA